MKTTKFIFSALVLFVAFSLNAVAQETANVKVYAKTVDQLTLTPDAGSGQDFIEFGTIQQNTVSYIAAGSDDITAETNLGINAHPAVIKIEGANTSTNIVVTDAILSDGTNTVAFTTTAFFYPDGGAGTVISGGNDDVTLSGNEDDLVLGGSLDAIANAADYDTDKAGGSPVTVTVQYN